MDGYEVLADFKVDNFKNDGVFYTDSNGLEMQRRVLNKRPTWDLEEDYKIIFANVTANYYPINSAISMMDLTSRQFTVCNDRS
jgi:lysosomal alpha-mannosidase